MLHRYDKRTEFQKHMKKGYGNDYIMAMNEVNHAAQANLSPGKAVWMMRT